MPGNVTNEEAWQHGRLLVVGTHQYIVDLNPPIVDKVCNTSATGSPVTQPVAAAAAAAAAAAGNAVLPAFMLTFSYITLAAERCYSPTVAAQ